jgi:hypothetical protein
MNKRTALVIIVFIGLCYLLFQYLKNEGVLLKTTTINLVQPPNTFIQNTVNSTDSTATLSNYDIKKEDNSSDYVKKLLSVKDKKLDILVFDFLNNKNISRPEKIKILLNVLEVSGFDSNQGLYFIDVLGSLKPIEVADKLIKIFQFTNLSVNAKNAILRVLADSYGLDPAHLPLNIAKLIAQKSILIQDFFKQQIQNPSNKEVFKQAIQLYPSVSSAKEVALLNNALIKNQGLISIPEALTIRLDSALATQTMQQNNLPQLLNSVKNTPFNQDIKQEFNARLFSYLKDAKAAIIVQDAVQPSIAEYIKNQQPILDINHADFNTLSNYFNWLQSYATMSSNQVNKNIFISDYAIKSATAIQQAAIVVFADNKLATQLQQNSLIQSNLQKELGSLNLTVEAKQVIQDAIQRLNQKN